MGRGDMRFTVKSVLVLCGMLSLGSGCGGGSAPANSASSATGEESSRQGGLPELHGEVGALDEGKVDSIFSDNVRALQRCLKQGAKRVEFIGGTVSFYVKVDSDGRLSHAHLERSTLGDRDTEKCMLDVLRAQPWPKPVGGETGLARKSFDFDPPNDVRPPAALSGDFVADALGKAEVATRIQACKQTANGQFDVTMYVDTEGQVLAVGAAPPDEEGETAVDCLVNALKSTSFPSPGSWPAKVNFAL
jgi:hypothetical protein